MSLMLTVSVPESKAFRRIANDHFIDTHHPGALFPHYKFVVQLFQIHPAQRRTTEESLHIRHGQNAPIAVRGFASEVVRSMSRRLELPGVGCLCDRIRRRQRS